MRLAVWILTVCSYTSVFAGAFVTSTVQAEEVQIRQLEAIQLYTQDELLALIQTNSHLRRVQDDDCQLVRDIEARADIMKLPAYQFLWGDMLAYAVCVPRDIERGWQLMQDAAAQGLPAGLEQVGRYYHIGRFVQPDERKAILYLREAAALGHVPATIRLADILLADAGSPRDYEQVYRWLHHSVTADSSTHQKIADLLRQLEQRMPERVVLQAREPVR
ncbi:tetratricopeptide repeat protein [Alkalimonas collagenimarina]|uniref:Tetratricopeptide repeat protein n=1 Tax=Alkalimonas collagenimarina TaxID=400390 RepID=A0ABT9GVL2_9GAMM|nr:tetratricopeptide repeat protein [Alkalimonas collagenimarina]MDP4535077.1 tetratricopeptide repeat protein [Alkalimonas collagenimarina]